MSLTDALAHERRLFYLLFASEDQKEGMAAFLEKRSARLPRPMNLGNPDRPVGGLSVPRPDGVEIRPLGRDDFADALALARELYGLPDGDPEPHRPAFDALVNDVDAAPFLAIADGEPAGFIGFRFRRRLNHATFEGWISDLVVRERVPRAWDRPRAARRRRSPSGGCAAVTRSMLEVGYERTAARALYESAGLRRTRASTSRSGRSWRAASSRPGASRSGRSSTTMPTSRPSPASSRSWAVRRRPRSACRPCVARTRSTSPSRDTGSLLALLDGDPVGFVSLEFRQPFFTPAPQAWIPDLVVTERRAAATSAPRCSTRPSRRRSGAARTRRRSSAGITAQVAHRLYVAAGMSDVGSFYTLAR